MTIPGSPHDLVFGQAALLREWLSRRASADAMEWLDRQAALIEDGSRTLQLATAVGLAPRKIGKSDLILTEDEQAEAHTVRSGLDTTGWSLDQTARIFLVLKSFHGEADAFAAGVSRLLAAAEIGEQIAILRGLALFPAPQHMLAHATEGVRSAMQPIFEAVAHRNPFPREHFSDAQWNQMVVKTLFIGSTLAPIQGLDERRNAELAQMLIDYAAERRAAGRSISPELWRCVAPFAGEAEVSALAEILKTGTEAERNGAVLALSECSLASAKDALALFPDIAAAARDGRIAWNNIA